MSRTHEVLNEADRSNAQGGDTTHKARIEQPERVHDSLPGNAVLSRLMVGSADDRAEQDADLRASRAVHALFRPPSAEPDRPAAAERTSVPVRRAASGGSGAIGRAGGQLDQESSDEIANRRGTGKQLSGQVQRSFGDALGADVSRARIHDDAVADKLARRMSATAFTVGNDIFFSAGSYQPETQGGAHLLAHELSHVVQPSGGGTPAGAQRRVPGATTDAIVHRKVGFELEDNTWESYQKLDDVEWTENPLYEPKGGPPPGGVNVWAQPAASHIDVTVKPHGVEAFKKKDKLHVGEGFALEADGPYSKGKMDIEFVTVPFEEDKKGLKQLDTAFDGIEKVMKRLTSMAPMPRNAEAGQFYRQNEHQLDNDEVLLAAGSKRPSFKMQVTHGVRLADIPALFETFGAVKDESEKDAKERGPARSIISPKLALQREIMGAAPGQARMVVDALQNKGTIPDGSAAELIGFFTFALAYVQWLQVLPWDGLKVALPFMSRYDFPKLLGMVPDAQRDPLKTVKGRKVLHRVIDTVVKKFGIKAGKRVADLGEGGGMMELHTMEGTPPAKIALWTLISSLTTEEWFDGILDGEDYLTGTGIYNYLHTQTADGADADTYEKSLHIYGRGHGATNSLVDAEPDLAIMENRALDPASAESTGLDVKQAREVATSYFKFLVSLRERGAKFPTMKLV